jgi:hypothetical protein
MNIDEYNAAVIKVLSDLEVEASINGNAKIDALAVIRMMVKYDSDLNVRTVRAAIFGLLLAQLPVTEDNVTWMIRDNQLGWFPDNELFKENHKIDLYPSMNYYKQMLESIHENEI